MSRIEESRGKRLRAATVSAMTLGLVLMAMGSANAQDLSGGCTATISGRQLPSMTFENPLVVTKGKRVRANASVPSSDRQATTNLDVKVGPISNSFSFKGNRYRRSMAPPSWLFDVADGVVKFSGTATGDGFTCAGSGYVKIDGAGFGALIGGVLLGGAGAAGVASASGPKEPPTAETLPPKAKEGFGHDLVELIKEIQREVGKDYGTNLGLLIALIIISFLVFGMMA